MKTIGLIGGMSWESTVPYYCIINETVKEKLARHATVGFVGTRFTMEQDFYRDRLTNQHGLTVLKPNEHDRGIVHRIICDELCLGKILDESRNEYRRIMATLVLQGAQAIILGCTEISLLVDQHDASVPLFDTTYLHARGAAEWALAEY